MTGNGSRSQARGRDGAQRHRAIEETNRSFVVEASAGTGKTSTLIRRILHLVLEKGPAGVPLALSRICAITFTEKAAGEMKVRLRQHFEEFLSGAPVPGLYSFDSLPPDVSASGEISGITTVLAQRAREALRDLETASISTFHSFAVSLLKERPVEAGLDPRFTALDEIRSELFFREVWELWISRALAERQPLLERALRNGFRMRDLEELARTLRHNRRAVLALQCDSPPTDDEIRERTGELLKRGSDFLGKALKSSDKLVDHLEKALQCLRDPEKNLVRPSKPGNAGSAPNWAGGKETVQTVRSFVREAADFFASCQSLPAQRLLYDLTRWMIDDFLSEWDRRKRAGALLDFDDQLWMARDLLLKSSSARREFQARYAALLVDEFQDTDALQWDIVRLLSSVDSGESDPARLRPGPGKLFIVGDPKQSIYRFRNADIETYLGIVGPLSMESLGLERLQLTTNFRSVPSILSFVDAAFRDVMQAPPDGFYQPDYLAFGGQGDRTMESSTPAVRLLGDRTNGSDPVQTLREFLGVKRRGLRSLSAHARLRVLEGSGSRSRQKRAVAPPTIRRHRDLAAGSQPCRYPRRSSAREGNPLCAGGGQILLCPQRGFLRDHGFAFRCESE
jgi:ATP-dependent exoDNAse (exonuclease V) beta subunit